MFMIGNSPKGQAGKKVDFGILPDLWWSLLSPPNLVFTFFRGV